MAGSKERFSERLPDEVVAAGFKSAGVVRVEEAKGGFWVFTKAGSRFFVTKRVGGREVANAAPAPSGSSTLTASAATIPASGTDAVDVQKTENEPKRRGGLFSSKKKG